MSTEGTRGAGNSRSTVGGVTAHGAGWYPDPAQRHQLRYWDGQRWTEHVSDDGRAGIDPLGDRTVFLDVQVRFGLGPRRRLVLDDKALHWDGASVRYRDITAMAYHVTEVTGNARLHHYELWLWTAAGETKVKFGVPSRDPAAMELFPRILGVLAEQVEVPLCRSIVNAIAGGDQVAIGPVTLNMGGVGRTGALVRDRSVPWRDVVGADRRHGDVRVWVTDSGERETIFRSVPVKEPNAVLLPRLLPVCRAAFRDR
jgi:hypothetical protein